MPFDVLPLAAIRIRELRATSDPPDEQTQPQTALWQIEIYISNTGYSPQASHEAIGMAGERGERQATARASWTLPNRYADMMPQEQADTLRACILRFLSQNGPAPASLIANEVGANVDSVRRALDYLATTQHLYMESWDSFHKVYYPNGRLAHTLLQGEVACGRTEYVIRTYDDRLTGRNLTVTEYRTLPTGERVARGGIRIDLVDLPALLNELHRISDAVQESEVIDRDLVTR